MITQELKTAFTGDASSLISEVKATRSEVLGLQKTVAGTDMTTGLKIPPLSANLKAESKSIGRIMGELRKEVESLYPRDRLGEKALEVERLGGSKEQVEAARRMIGEIEERREAEEAALKVKRQQKEVEDAAEARRDRYVAREIARTRQLASEARRATMAGPIDQVERSGLIDRLKPIFGGRGILKEFVELGLGAGAVGGLSFLTGQIGDMAEKAVELRDALRDDSKNAADLALELGKSTPVLGGIVRAGASINELLTDQKREIEAINAAADRQSHIADLVRAGFAAARDDAEDIARFMREVGSHLGTVGRSGIDLALAQITGSASDRKLGIADAMRRALGSNILAPEDKDLADRRKTYEDLAAQVKSFPITASLHPSSYAPEGGAIDTGEDSPEQLARNREYAELLRQRDEAKRLMEQREREIRGNAMLKTGVLSGMEFIDTQIAKAGDAWDRYWDRLAVHQEMDREKRERDLAIEQLAWSRTFRSIESDESLSIDRRYRKRIDFIEKLNKDGKLEKLEYERMKAEALQDVDDAAARAKADAMTPIDKLTKRVGDLKALLNSGRISRDEFGVDVANARRELFGDGAVRADTGQRFTAPIVPRSLAAEAANAAIGSSTNNPQADIRDATKQAARYLTLLYQYFTNGQTGFGQAAIP